MCLASACNKNSSEAYESEIDMGNCAVTSFSLLKDDSVLTSLDSVFFSIDLINARIYNADSLPVGTKTSKLLVNIGTDNATAIDLTFKIPGTTRDTTISYLDSPKDSINFADGPVTLFIRAADNTQTRTYSIAVNVHKSAPDTLCWSDAAVGSLYTSVNMPFTPVAQNTTEIPGTSRVVSAAINADGVAIYEERDLTDGRLTGAGSLNTLPAAAVMNSFTAIDATTFAILAGGKLFLAENINSTADLESASWTDTGERFDYIYGVTDGMLLGARHDNDGWKHVSHPAAQETPVPSGFPVSGTSRMLSYETKWSATPMSIIVGGRTADGSYTGDAWAHDGTKWGQLSTLPLPAAEGYAVVPYNTPRVNKKNWTVTERSALLAMGSRGLDEGNINASTTVYISYDWGITWSKADLYLQFPESMKPFYGAMGFTGVSTLSIDESQTEKDSWHPTSVRPLPVWCRLATQAPLSRVTTPIDEWECPYIYLFGGADANGNQLTTIWRGVIARYTFRPLY